MEKHLIEESGKPPSSSRQDEKIRKILSGFYEKQAAEAKSWQSYSHHVVINENNVLPVGFVKGYDADNNYQILRILDRITIFPQFCCSLYGAPGTELHNPSVVPTPSIGYSRRYHNVGTDCFVKAWDCFMMFVGWSATIMDDLQQMLAAARQEGLWSGNDMITDLFYLAVEGLANAKEDYIQVTKRNRAIYADIDDRCDYAAFVDKSADILTAILLSPVTRKQIQDSDKPGLTPVCQMHFGLGGYHAMLKRDYGWDEYNCAKAAFMGLKHPIFAVTPPIYAHQSGAFYDSQTNMMIGKRRQLAEFLRFLDQKKMLDEKDLHYLIPAPGP
ncbi:MAG: hypothetical protein AB1724_01545 [Thermodesulfobacteriota bacterium]